MLGVSASVIAYFENRKHHCQEDLLFAESQPGFKWLRRTDHGGKGGATEELHSTHE
jgi:hypothetical protein